MKNNRNDTEHANNNQASIIEQVKNNRILSAINQTGLLKSISPEKLLPIDNWGEIIDAYEGNLIITEGTPGDYLYIILEGEIDVFTVNDENNLCVIAQLGAGDYFGEQALLDENTTKRNASVMAVSSCKLIKINKLFFRKVLKKDGDLYLTLKKKGITQYMENEKQVELQY